MESKQEHSVKTPVLSLTEVSNTCETSGLGIVVFPLVCRVCSQLGSRCKKTTCPIRPQSQVPDVYRAGREEGPFPSHLVASSSEVFAPSLVESEENPAEGAPSCPDKCKKASAAL